MGAAPPPAADGSGLPSGAREEAGGAAVAPAAAAFGLGAPHSELPVEPSGELPGEPPGAPPREPPGEATPPPGAPPPGALAPSFGLPVADLVGLRFSVVHLRLAGYALLGVWANEIVGLLSSPLLVAVGTRLHYISQALDVSPLLLVGIALVAYQGGLQRSLPERLLLPLLLGLLPVLSAIHFLMAPASIANAVTLSAKQEEVSKAQLQTIDGQLDRAGRVLVSSQDLEELRRRLDAIPGVRVSTAPDANLEQVRREVRESLLNERRRLRSRIGTNTAQARNQFARRSIQNASLGMLVGLMLAWMRFGAMREMDLSSTYLAWVILSDSKAPNLRGLKDLLAFQTACLATSYLGLLERFLSRRRIDGSESDQQPAPIMEPLPLPEAPWEGGVERIEIKPVHWRRQAGLFRGGQNESVTSLLDEPEPGWDYEDAFPDAVPTPAQKRRSERDRRRVKEALERFSATVSDSYAGYDPDADAQRQPQGRRPSARQLRQAREALERFAAQIQHDMADPHALEDEAFKTSADQGLLGSGGPRDPGRRGPDRAEIEAAQSYAATPRPGVRQPNPLRVLIHWVITHL